MGPWRLILNSTARGASPLTLISSRTILSGSHAPVVLHFVRIGRVHFFDERVGLVGARNREAPRDPLVVTERDADKRRLLRADHVPGS